MSGDSPFQSIDLDSMDEDDFKYTPAPEPVKAPEPEPTKVSTPEPAKQPAQEPLKPMQQVGASEPRNAFEPLQSVSKTEDDSNPFKPVAAAPARGHLSVAKSAEYTPYEEPNKIFATGLPDWNLEPPGEFVARKTNKPKEGKE